MDLEYSSKSDLEAFRNPQSTPSVHEGSRYIINTGWLSSWKYPNIAGIDTFKGKLMHSANWDNAYDLSGKTVAVIGGGSSAVQIIPSIQPGMFTRV
jgi:cation diffusion facilitator CzcD-associated flavoprotein CzcO